MPESQSTARRKGISPHPFIPENTPPPLAQENTPSDPPTSAPSLPPPLKPSHKNEPVVVVTARLPQSIHRAIKIRSAYGWGTIQDLFTQALQEWLERHPLSD
jgi:hypothetical protein